ATATHAEVRQQRVAADETAGELFRSELVQLFRIGVLLFEAAPCLRGLGGDGEFIRCTAAHRWHPEQCSGGLTAARASLRPLSVQLASGFHSMFVISFLGRRFGPGSRWQSRHQPMLIGSSIRTTSIWSTWP